MVSEAKRLKLDPELVTEETMDDYEEQEHIKIVPVKEDKEYSSLDSLPKEIIHEICMLLSLRDKMSLRLVSRQLYTVCSDPCLWTNVFIDDAYHKTNAPFIKSVLKTCQPYVQSLSLKGQLPFSQYQPRILNCKNIHMLNLYGFEISLGALEKISSPSYLPHLQYLTLTIDKRNSIELFGTKFSCFSHLEKLVIVGGGFLGGSHFFQKWLEIKCLPHILIVVGYSTTIQQLYKSFTRAIQPPLITHSAHFAAYKRYPWPLNFDFFDIPLYSLQLGPNNPETVAVTANGELMVTLRDFVTPTTQPNNDDLSQQYAVFDNKNIAPGLPVYTSQYGFNVTVLEFESVTLSLESFRLIVKDTPNVLEVSLKRSTISDYLDAYLVPLSEHCLKLRGLNLSTFGDSGYKIDVERFWYLLSKMLCLKLLSVNCRCLIPPITDSTSSLEGGGSSQVSHLLHIEAARDNMINYIKSMSSLKGLDVTHCQRLCACYQYLLPIISNLQPLIYLRVNFQYASEEVNGLKEVLQNCQQLSVLCIDKAKLTLPVDPALYSNLTHLRLDSISFTSDFVTALAVNSKRNLKHFFSYSKIEEDFVLKLMECSFITLRVSSSLIKKKFRDSEKGLNSDFDAVHLH